MKARKKYPHIHVCFVFCFVFMFSVISSTDSRGAYLRNIPVKVVQPNGEKLNIFASGDEFYNWLHDKEGYTIVQDPVTGYFVYAIKENGKLVPSDAVAGSVNPKRLRLAKDLAYSADKRAAPSSLFPGGSPANTDEILAAPKTGTINNIVIFIRFSGESEFTDAISTYDNMFNLNTAGSNSMLNYFVESSYSQLTVSSTFYPTSTTTVVSYQDSNSRGYYQPYSITNPGGYTGGNSGTERRTREHTLLKNAVDAVSSQVPGSLNIDADGDGLVDNVCFIIYGAPTGWSSLLWPHMWSLWTQTATINGKRVYTYNFQLQTALASSGVGVLSHEMFHSLGSPDLYHYSSDSLHPVYTWGLMANDSDPPRHMGAFMKYRYGTWISSIPEITDGTHSLNPITSSSGNCYKVTSPNSSTEYFVLEYRRKTGTFESSLPATGLLVYRINTSEDGNGNRNGPPDEVYIYRPGGTTSNDGTPLSANFSSEVGRTSINDSTDPSGFLSDGSAGGIDISNIGSAGDTISFQLGQASSCPDCPSDGNITNAIYATGTTCSCTNATSITLDGTVTVQDGATVTFTAPTVTVKPGFTAASGSTVAINQP